MEQDSGMTRQRHFGLDWLRIGAFALLIGYHVAMAYSPHAWVINSHHRFGWLAYAMEAIAPWRLMLLFLVSGYASAMLLARLGGIAAFMAQRSRRLLIPLFFAVAVIVPPQSWVRQVTGHGYADSYLHFWLDDYFRFGQRAGETLPHWEHLWFVGYLWLYTAGLVALLALGVRLRLPDWLRRPTLLLALPIAGLAGGRLLLDATIGTDHGLFDDWLGHLHYIPPFLLGFVLARDRSLWKTLHACLPIAAAIAALLFVTVLVIEIDTPDKRLWSDAQMILFESADSGFAWAMLLILPVLADRFLNHDHRWRRPLSQAVFPAYIAHQTAIVVLVYALRDRGLPAMVEAALVLGGTIAACCAALALARSNRWAGMVLGYEATATPQPAAAAATV